jgi:exodeoxyribonuclease VII small subunit
MENLTPEWNKEAYMSTPITSIKPVEELSFELAFAEMESIVSALESEKYSLDEAMALFERGQSLARYCSELLEKAELKIQQLSGDGLSDFTPQDN